MNILNQTFVDVDFLNSNINHPNIVILDCSTITNVNKVNIVSGIIPKARHFDLKNTFRNQESKYPNTIPSEKKFQKGCRDLGINNNDFIIVYDNVGIYTSPRVWWLFRYMGFHNIAILDGGLKEWITKGYDIVDTYLNVVTNGDFTANENIEHYRSYAEVYENIDSKAEKIIDARSSGRFNGTEPEPREGLSSGSIPNSINIPFKDVLNDHLIKSNEDLLKVFSRIRKEDNLVFSCGSGTTACILLAAANQVLENDLAMFDGSWTEWALKSQSLDVESYGIN